MCVCLSDFAEVLILSSMLESQQIISEVEKSQKLQNKRVIWKYGGKSVKKKQLKVTAFRQQELEQRDG